MTQSNFPVLNDKLGFKYADYSRTYRTKNYDLFICLDVNRGAKNGIEPQRVKAILNKIKSGEFSEYITHVLVNLDGWVIDGCHRLEALKQMGMSVNFMIIIDDKYNNISINEFANRISNFNNSNTTWGDKNNHTSALAAGEPCALQVQRYINKVNSLNQFEKNPITPSRMIGLVSNFTIGQKDVKQSRSVFCDDNLATIMATTEFEHYFDGCIQLMYAFYLKNKIVSSFFIARQIIEDYKQTSINVSNVRLDMDWNKLTIAFNKYAKDNHEVVQCGKKVKSFKKISQGVILLSTK